MFKRRGLASITHQTVVGHLRDGRLIVGIVKGVHKDAFVMSGASTPEGDKFVGDVVIPREQLVFFQADVPAHLLKTIDREEV